VTLGLIPALWDHHLDRWEGVVLVVMLGGYLAYLFYKREVVMEDDIPTEQATWRDGPLLLLGLVMIVGGSRFLVDSSIVLARVFGMSEQIIGLTVVAAGTSVPEFVISLTAVLKKRHGISVGNLIGSNLFNTLGVLGVAAVLTPLTVESSIMINVGSLTVISLTVLLMMRTGWRVSRWEGAILVLLSGAVWLINFVTQGGG
jgi:cation:H+ antiporter